GRGRRRGRDRSPNGQGGRDGVPGGCFGRRTGASGRNQSHGTRPWADEQGRPISPRSPRGEDRTGRLRARLEVTVVAAAADIDAQAPHTCPRLGLGIYGVGGHLWRLPASAEPSLWALPIRS